MKALVGFFVPLAETHRRLASPLQLGPDGSRRRSNAENRHHVGVEDRDQPRPLQVQNLGRRRNPSFRAGRSDEAGERRFHAGSHPCEVSVGRVDQVDARRERANQTQRSFLEHPGDEGCRQPSDRHASHDGSRVHLVVARGPLLAGSSVVVGRMEAID